MALSVRASSGATIQSTSITVTKPAGTVNDDVMWAVVVFPADLATIGTVTDPSGWTRDATLDSAAGAPGHCAILLHKVASSEGADYTWSWPSTRKVSVGIISIDGVDTGSPTEGFTTNIGGPTTAHVCDGVTPTESDSLFLAIFTGNNPGSGINGAYTPPAGFTERRDQPADDGGFGDAPYLSICTKQLAASGFAGDATAISNESTRFACYGVMVTSDNPSSDASVFVNEPIFADVNIPDMGAEVSTSSTPTAISASTLMTTALVTDSGGAAPDPMDGFSIFLGFGSEPFGTVAWTDVTQDVMSFSTSRGRSSELQRYGAGTATITLLNNLRLYDPLYEFSPYNGQLLPAVPVLIRARNSTLFTEDIFRGYVRLRGGFTPNYPAQTVSTVTVSCVDLFGLLAAKELAEIEIGDGQTFEDVAIGTNATTGSLATVILAVFGDVPAAHLAEMQDGRTVTQGTTLGTNLLDFVQTCAETEGGNVYVDSSGVIHFDDRYAPFLDVEKANALVAFGHDDVQFRDDGSLTVDYASAIYNKARVNRETGAVQEFSDASSIAAYTEATFELRDLFMKVDPDAYARAEWYVAVYGGTIAAPQSLTITPRLGGDVQDAALSLDLRHRVSVTFEPPGGGDPISQECFVEKIAHQVNFGTARNWTTQFEFSSALAYEFTSPDDWLVLDDATDGLLDDSRRMAF